MQYRFLSLIVLLSCTLFGQQDSTKKIDPDKLQIAGVYKNSFSLNLAGTSGVVGFSWENLITKRLISDIGIGFPGIGLGIRYLPIPVKRGTLRPHLNVISSFMVWPGAAAFQQFYGGAGLSLFLTRKFNFSFDLGPSWFYHYWVATGKAFPDRFFLMGNVKAGYRFSFYAMKRRNSYFDN